MKRISTWIDVGVAVVVLAILSLFVGCTNPNRLAVEQAKDYHETLVEGVLLPFYLDPAPEARSPAQKMNVQAAVDEHGQFLEEWQAGFSEP